MQCCATFAGRQLTASITGTWLIETLSLLVRVIVINESVSQQLTYRQTGLIGFAVQSYFALRVWHLVKRNWLILVPLWSCILVGLGGLIALVRISVAGTWLFADHILFRLPSCFSR